MPSRDSPAPPAHAAMPTRRRFLAALGAASALGMPGWQLPPADRDGLRHEWRGTALGAPARITLHHFDRIRGVAALEVCRAEIDRLENEFSLYRADFALSRLNREGELLRPSLDMRRLVEQSLRFGAATGGRFDITIQPLWRLLAESAGTPDRRAAEAALGLVDYRQVEAAVGRIAFAREGMAATLNGIAQGYVTDRIADLLQDLGFAHVLINAGEFRAATSQADDSPWRIALRHPPFPDRTYPLATGALATSGGHGTRLSADGQINHLLDPATGASAPLWRTVTVAAPRASDADALSTALCLCAADERPSLLQAVADACAIVTEPGAAAWEARS